MESKKPLISILCALRNEEEFIRQALDSVIKQTYANWELIMFDAVSTDTTATIIKEYAAKHKNISLHSEPDKGQWDALDKALALAKGEYITILCGNDGYLDERWFERCIGVFNEHPEVSLVWGIPFNMNEEDVLLGPHYAYAGFLKDDKFGSQIKPVSSIAAKIDLKHEGAWKRFTEILHKITWTRIVMMAKTFWKSDIPEKEDWFFYWLQTSRAFPEGNMVMRREAYIKNTVRFPEEKQTTAALLDFCYEFNARGYLAYGLPVAASFGRTHAGTAPLPELDAALTANYRDKIAKLRDSLKHKTSFTFVDAAGKPVAERKL
jgi:glycosyltransferase involved in cell wall biosynthesis